MKKLDVGNMTVKQFRAIGALPWDKEVRCQSLIILPLGGRKRDLHDSGYRCMDFIAVNDDGTIMGRISGSSDVINIEGIGGFGKNGLNRYGKVPDLLPPREWNIDCLAKSGCLRLFSGYGIICTEALSSFSIYSADKDKP